VQRQSNRGQRRTCGGFYRGGTHFLHLQR